MYMYMCLVSDLNKRKIKKMPKSSRENVQRFYYRMVQMYPSVLDIESSILFCKLCHCNINGTKIFSVQQHFRTLKHRNAQLSLPAPGICPPRVKSELDTFSLDLCTTFLEANIPLETINHPAMQVFLLKYIQETIPKEATLRAEYVPALCERYIQKLQEKAKNMPIWISITESMNSEHDLLVNFVFGIIEENEKGKCYLLNIGRLKRANASSLAAFFNHSLQILWPQRILYENIYLVVTETIPYMTTAIRSLKILYPNMIHVNCLLQAMDRLVQFIRTHFNQVDTFLMNCEAVFSKSPHRRHLMRSKYNSLNLPPLTAVSTDPAPAPARTWLNSAIYYYDNFKEINALLRMLSEEDDAECIQQARQLIGSTPIKTDLIYIKENFQNISQAIAKLENRDLTLSETLAAIGLIKAAIQDTKRLELISKFEQIIGENSGLQELIAINHTDNSFIGLKIYKFVPIVCANIEHLSYAKNLFDNNAAKIFDFQNVKTEV